MLNMPMGGKTGTTQNSDGWFMGFTPSLASGVSWWRDRAIHFDNIAEGQGVIWRCRYGPKMQKLAYY